MDGSDLAAILGLLADYGATLDEQRWDDHLALWSEDGCLHVFGRDFEGHEKIDRFMRQAHQGKHLTATPRVHIEGNRAESVSDFVFFRKGEVTLFSAGVYRDRFVRCDPGWKFERREIEIQLRAED